MTSGMREPNQYDIMAAYAQVFIGCLTGQSALIWSIDVHCDY